MTFVIIFYDFALVFIVQYMLIHSFIHSFTSDMGETRIVAGRCSVDLLCASAMHADTVTVLVAVELCGEAGECG